MHVAVITFIAGWVLRFSTRHEPPAAAGAATVKSFHPKPVDAEGGKVAAG